jgi:hypothetical protein
MQMRKKERKEREKVKQKEEETDIIPLSEGCRNSYFYNFLCFFFFFKVSGIQDKLMEN